MTIADRFAGCVEQLRALYVPPTTEESAEFERLKAREMALHARYKSAVIHAPTGFRVELETGTIFGHMGRPIGTPNTRGYVHVRKGSQSFKAHRVVFEAANGPIPDGLEINHINGVKTDNRLANLEMVTPAENQRHAYRTGLKDSKGEAHSRAKLTDEKVRAIRGPLNGCSAKFLAKLFGVCESNIRYVKRGKAWPHVRAEAARNPSPQLELPERE